MEEEMKTRKRVFVEISPDALKYFLVPGEFEVLSSPVPRDAKYLGIQYDVIVDRFLVCFEHKSFKPIPYGERLPILEPIEIKRRRT